MRTSKVTQPDLKAENENFIAHHPSGVQQIEDGLISNGRIQEVDYLIWDADCLWRNNVRIEHARTRETQVFCALRMHISGKLYTGGWDTHRV